MRGQSEEGQGRRPAGAPGAGSGRAFLRRQGQGDPGFCLKICEPAKDKVGKRGSQGCGGRPLGQIFFLSPRIKGRLCLFRRLCREHWKPTHKTIKPDSYLTPGTTVNSKRMDQSLMEDLGCESLRRKQGGSVTTLDSAKTSRTQHQSTDTKRKK